MTPKLTFRQARDFLMSFIPAYPASSAGDEGMRRMRYLLEQLGSPHRGRLFVHVGGTSGKGSTATMLAAILTAAGYKTGLHVSPDVRHFGERAQINGRLLGRRDFTTLIEEMKPAIAATEAAISRPSYFEITLAMALWHFARQDVDAAVVEVGLGGRLDGTNLIECQHQILTNIGLDHTAVLGRTKTAILRDKQEIIKPGSLVVTGITEPALIQQLEAKVEVTGSRLSRLGRDFTVSGVTPVCNSRDLPAGTKFTFSNPTARFDRLQTGLAGQMQAFNSALAVQTALNLQPRLPNVTGSAVRRGLVEASAPGRFDVVSRHPLIIFDAAHNPDKIRTLVTDLQQYLPDYRFTTIARYKQRPDIWRSLRELMAVTDQLILTSSRRCGDMGLEPSYDDLAAARAKRQFGAEAYADPVAALQRARLLAADRPGTGILVTGSIFLLSDLYPELIKRTPVKR